MAITDIQISEELETSAPSIKYRGNEGPKSPEEEQMMMQTSVDDPFYRGGEEDDHSMRMFGKPYKELNADELEEFREEMMRLMNKFSKGPVLPSDEDPINPFGPKPEGPLLPDRQMAAYGGIMGVDGRRQYGIGSSFKKAVRKLIPNEIAEIAVKAAPFVAPFNPLAAGLMSGIGGFDQTGRIGSSLKSGLMNYGLGQVARGIGGGMGNLQTGFNPMGGMQGMKYGFSSPLQGEGGLSKFLEKRKAADTENLRRAAMSDANVGFGNQDKNFLEKTISKIGEYVPTSFSDFKDPKKILGALGIYKVGKELLGGPEEVVSEIMDRGEGLDLDSIRLEVREAFKDSSGQKLLALRNKYPYLGTQASKNISAMAMGGRAGMAEGGIMDLGGMEKDYRAEGGFVPIGREEKADDVPARLSVNEFVFTADAVRNAGGGDIDKGAEVMENMMKNLEAGGQVSEESQGMAGAQKMFETSERLSEVI